MANFDLEPGAWSIIEKGGKKIRILKKADLERFNPQILGLGNISTRSKAIAAVAAVFDLEGFTQFCGQIEPQLSVPDYLNRFLGWLMDSIKKETIQEHIGEGTQLWHPLPFFVKYMGDGLLVLWNASDIHSNQVRNLILSLYLICENYPKKLLPQVKHSIVCPPSKLRCGVARGTVYSVGENADYVGSCINMAARVQKLPGVTFAFNRRGVDLEGADVVQWFKEGIVVKKVNIRGIGSGELLGLLKADLKKMDEADRALYEEP